MNEKTIMNELALLKADLKNGDEIITETSPSGKQISHSKKVGDARIKVINMVRESLTKSEITGAQAGELTRLFGKKTTSIYWIK